MPSDSYSATMTEDWKDQAKCWGKTTSPDTDYWFPDPEEPEDVRHSKTQSAKAICLTCPVKEECLRYAIEFGEVYGIWGGKTNRERSVIRRQWEKEAEVRSYP
jgi:WhiB family redox-sensing transcriptional regulator